MYFKKNIKNRNSHFNSSKYDWSWYLIIFRMLPYKYDTLVGSKLQFIIPIRVRYYINMHLNQFVKVNRILNRGVQCIENGAFAVVDIKSYLLKITYTYTLGGSYSLHVCD